LFQEWKVPIHSDLYPSKTPFSMLTTTTEQIMSTQVKSFIGMVSGTSIIGGEDRELLLTALAAAADGIPMAYERLEKEARLQAIDRMREQAKGAGGHAVLGVRVKHEVMDAEQHITMVFAMGTAVELRFP
jgi:uncharacterized protein YbjQ (UPF0145 family)